MWSARGGQTGTEVAPSNEAWNGTLAPGGSVSFDFNGTHGQQPAAATFTLNGSACTSA